MFALKKMLEILRNPNLTDMNKPGIVELKQVVKLEDLLLYTRYPIVGAKIVRSKFGEAVLLELENGNFKCFSPKKVTDNFEQQIENSSAGKSCKFEIVS